MAHAAPIRVEVVETVGAGDAFDAGFLSGRLRGRDLREAPRLGNLLGGLATVPGDTEGLPTWTEAQTYLDGEGSRSAETGVRGLRDPAPGALSDAVTGS